MLGTIVKIALALEFILVCGEEALPATHTYLPLAGSHLAQFGLIVGLPIACLEVWEAVSNVRNRTISATDEGAVPRHRGLSRFRKS